MRFVDVVHHYYSSFLSEASFLQHKLNSQENPLYVHPAARLSFGYLSDQDFYRLLNTISWLYRFAVKSPDTAALNLLKPADQDFLDFCSFVEGRVAVLHSAVLQYPDSRQAANLSKVVKHHSDFLKYLRSLVDQGYFLDKHLN